jgi:hypothetical protein
MRRNTAEPRGAFRTVSVSESVSSFAQRLDATAPDCRRADSLGRTLVGSSPSGPEFTQTAALFPWTTCSTVEMSIAFERR